MGRLSKAKVIDALTRADGFVSVAAAHLDCSRRAVYDYINKYPEVAEAFEDIREAKKDFAEGVLQGLIAEGDKSSIHFYLRTIGKDRGYVEKTETDNKTEMRVVVEDASE